MKFIKTKTSHFKMGLMISSAGLEMHFGWVGFVVIWDEKK